MAVTKSLATNKNSDTTKSTRSDSGLSRKSGRTDGRSRPNAKATRQRILQAAVEHLTSETASTDEGRTEGLINSVVRRSGLTKGALYHHFDGQAALLTALVDEYLAASVQTHWLNPLNQGRSRWRQLRNIFSEMTASPDKYLPAFTIAALLSSRLRPGKTLNAGQNLNSKSQEGQSAASAALDELFAVWVEAIAEAIAEDSEETTAARAHILALAMLSAFTGAALAARTAGSSDVFAGAVSALTELLVNSR